MKYCSFQPVLWPSSAEEQDFSQHYGFHRDLQTPAMSTDSSQVGVALFPSCLYIFYHFTFPGFPFLLISRLVIT